MAALSDTLENRLIDWLLRGQALGLNGATAAAGSGPANTFVALLTAAPSDAGGGTEVSTAATGYARVAVASSLANWAGTQAAASTAASSGTTGTTSNNTVVTFPAPTAAWGSVTAFGIYDAATGGNLLFFGTLAAAKTINAGDPAPTFPAGTLTFQIDN